MNLRLTTTLILAALIAGALLSLGIRHQIDARREAASAGPPAGKSMSSPAIERRPPARTGPEPGTVARRDALFLRLRAALSTANEVDRSRALLALIDDLEPTEFPLIMDGIEQQRMSPNGFNRAAAEMLTAWAAVDPGPAVLWEIQWAEKRGLGDNTNVPTVALIAWLKRDPDAVEQWWLAPSMEAHRNLLTYAQAEIAGSEVEGRAKSLAGGDLTRAMAAIRDSPEKERSRLTSCITDEVLQRGPAAIRQWLEAVDDPTLRRNVLAVVISRGRALPASDRVELYRQNPEIGKQVDPGALYGDYARENEGAALAGFDELPEGPEKLAATQSLISRLSDYPARPDMVVKIMDLYPEAVTDGVVARWMEMFGNSGEAPAYLAELPRIQSEELRDRKRREILNQWIRSDPSAAREWIDGNEIPEPLRRELEER